MNNVQIKRENIDETERNEDKQIRNIRYIKQDVLPKEVDAMHNNLNCEFNFNNTIVKQENSNNFFAKEQNESRIANINIRKELSNVRHNKLIQEIHYNKTPVRQNVGLLQKLLTEEQNQNLIANINIMKQPTDVKHDEINQEINFNNATAKEVNELRSDDFTKEQNQSYITDIRIKSEPDVPEENSETERINASEYKNLYPDHEVKDDMAIGPTLIGTMVANNQEIDNEIFANKQYQNLIANINIKKEPADVKHDEFSQEINFNNVTANEGYKWRNNGLTKEQNQSYITDIRIKTEPHVPEENSETERMKLYQCVKKEREESLNAHKQDEVSIEESNKYDDINSDGSDYDYDSEEDIDTEEPEDGNASEYKNLYPDHEIKEEMTIGPTLISTVTAVPGVQNITAKKKTKSHVCQTCNDTFTSLQLLKEHTQSHGGDKYVCDVCSKHFKNSTGLKLHRRIHIDKRLRKQYRCKVCSKRFNYYGFWKQHMLTHPEKKTYVCDVCSKICRDSFHLKYHSLVHTDEKPYACEICTKSFKDKVFLNRHIRLHTSERPYECEVCSKRFKHIRYLKVHVRIHKREKSRF